ncbi:MAG: hypothetical protein C5B50_05980 [Verrucomicrobia bacterium]|nr:MAG: hypothetical protein C5B50_05980 [Verrucomicrobiota bacterium]
MANAQIPPEKPTSRATLGLTGLTINAMALIAPGAFLWLTFQEQSLYGAPMAGCAMWFGIFAALLLCLATAISYAELSKIFPGAGSSYLYAEQAFLSRTKWLKFARVAKFFTGWASHLYYWVYPGCMVGVTAILVGYLSSVFWPNTFSSVYNSPLEMFLFCIVFAFGVGYIAFRGVNGTTAVNMAINIIQISALIVFSLIAIAYRVQHPEGSPGFHLSGGNVVTYNVDQVNVTDDKNKPVQDTFADGSPRVDDKNQPVYKQQDRTVAKDDLDAAKNKDAAVLGALTDMKLGEGDPYPAFQKDEKGSLKLDKNGHAIADPFTITYKPGFSGAGTAKDPKTFNNHETAVSVIAPHGLGLVFIQACIAILILVGFESVTAMGEEAKNAKRDVPRAVILSLAIQGGICYFFEYFAANYLLHNGYTLSNAAASGAPIGDLMLLTGTWLFGSASAGKAFMIVQAITVFLALIGTTLSCLSTGARVTYAMGRDEEVPSHFGLLHGKHLSPHRAIWTLVILSVIIGIITCSIYLGAQSSDLAALDKHNIWYSFGIFSPHAYTWLPNTFLLVTLVSNFGTFMLYMMTCMIAMVAFKEHHSYSGIKHFVIPWFGLLANAACMLFYLIGPIPWLGGVSGMSWHEPYLALLVAALWGGWGLIYFKKRSAQLNKPAFLVEKPVPASA